MIDYKKPRKNKQNKVFDVDKLEWSIQEYQQRKDRKVKAVIIDNNPLTKRDKVKFICERCKIEVELFSDKFVKRKGEKLCRSCAISVYHERNPDWLELSEEQKKNISEKNSGPRIKDVETRICPSCGKKFKVRLTAHNMTKKYCSKECNIKNWSEHGKENGGQYGYLGSKPFHYKSKPERQFKSLLEEYNINFKHQKFIKINNKMHSFDFWLPDHNTFIEVDGDYWHYNTNNPNVNKKPPNKKQINRMELDKEKNEYCKKNNIKLIRIWASELEERAEQVLEQLDIV